MKAQNLDRLGLAGIGIKSCDVIIVDACREVEGIVAFCTDQGPQLPMPDNRDELCAGALPCLRGCLPWCNVGAIVFAPGLENQVLGWPATRHGQRCSEGGERCMTRRGTTYLSVNKRTMMPGSGDGQLGGGGSSSPGVSRLSRSLG